MRKIIFDIKSFQEINHKYFFWPTADKEYFKLSKQITQILSQSCPDFYLYQFSVVQNQIAKGLFEYTSLLYDLKKIRIKNKIITNLKNQHYLKNILSNTPVELSYNYNLELNRRPKNFFRNYFIKILWKLTNLNDKNYVVSKNQLLTSFKKKLYSESFVYFPPIYFLGIDKKIESNNVSELICNSFIKLFEKNIFLLGNVEKKSINNLITIYLTRLQSDLYKIEKFFTKIKKCKSIITGTGDQYFNRLMSYYAKINGICSIRFDHGGDRIFFKDDYNLKNELSFVDKYYTFGNLGSKYLLKLTKNLKIPKIKIYGISFDHNKIEEKNNNNLSKKKQRILFIGQSLVGESRNPFGYKLFDPILYDWQYFLLKNLKKNGVQIILKIHPKGILPSSDSLESLAYGVMKKSMNDSLREFDLIITDYVGTAFLEALSCGKKIILLDTLKRNFNPEIYDVLKKNIKIIKCFWRKNLLRVNITDLIHAIDKLRYKKSVGISEFYNSIYK